MRSSDKNKADNGFTDFELWLRSLDRSQLLDAMEFSFEVDEGKQQIDGEGSHEYSLFLQMLQMQSPTPTPVHPRAVWYKPASGKGKTDGRNEALRVLRNRKRRPRFFRWFENKGGISFDNTLASLGLTSRSISSSNVGRRKGRAGGRRDKMRGSVSPPGQRFEVVARKFGTPWGDEVCDGVTNAELAADEAILNFSLVDHVDDTDSKPRIYMSFIPPSEVSNATAVLEIIKVASRGHFLSIPRVRQQSSRSNPSFCAPWLDPTERFFSLSMYIASRFEVALWNSYERQNRVRRLRRNRPWDDLQRKLSNEVLMQTIYKALQVTLIKDVIARDKVLPPNYLRDGLTIDLVESTEFWRAIQLFFHREHRQPAFNPKRFVQSISMTPIVELGTSKDRIRNFVRQRLKSEISAQIGKDLVASSVHEYPAIVQTAPPRRGRKKKKKQRQKTGRRKQYTEKDVASNTAQAGIMAPDSTTSDDDDDDSIGQSAELSRVDYVRLSFPENGTPFVERNRNIVLCLSMLNDVINGAFQQVGLEVSSDESESSVIGSRKSKPKAAPPKLTMQTQNQKTKKQSFDATKEDISKDEEDDTRVASDDAHVLSPGEDESQAALSPSLGPVDSFPSQYSFPPGFFLRAAPFQSSPWDFSQTNTDGWSISNRFQPRERSILTDFFLEQEIADAHRQERVTASSTAASLASSTDKNNEDTISISDKFFISLDNGSEPPASDFGSVVEVSAEEFPALGIYQEEQCPVPESTEIVEENIQNCKLVGECDAVNTATGFEKEFSTSDANTNIRSRSLSPEAPATPSPRLSPILLSLDDLRDIREGAKTASKAHRPGVTLSVPSSLPSSPVEQSKRSLVPNLSRGDLRTKSFRDDHVLARRKRQKSEEPSPSYRNVVAGSARAPATRTVSSDALKSMDRGPKSAFFPRKKEQPAEICARSETAAELRDDSHNSSGALSYRNVAAKSVKSVSGGSWNQVRQRDQTTIQGSCESQHEGELCVRSETAVDDYQTWHESRRSHEENPDNITVGKDGSTTITSAMSNRESEETSNLREERNTFRDMCLTLGAEVAKLKNQLAAQQGATLYSGYNYSPQGFVQPLFGAASFDPECMPPFFQNGQAIGAMSDAGVHRAEYESQVSEDDEQFGKVNYNDGRRPSSGNTIAGSDVSIEPTSSSHALQGTVGLPIFTSGKDTHEAGTVSGLRTRLTEDILRFLNSAELQHRKLDKARNAAVERMTRLVNTLWPRAQVKVYGSHVTGLCLPSSDLDFVICLPAVHKNAPASLPGVLEGRNAINETSQKLLARKLKSESWIDPRSMKLIERTVVPVIKVATKDTRARTMQLDISFDSPEHHGLEAVVMVKQIIDELPMLRPLVLVLKQFLLDRALLTAYTGGLSSYCLFLMVARYLQEQPTSWGDCGSLLMGFLDFYGNYFDPRSTGISVGRRQYFTRPNYMTAQRQAAGPHMWPGVSPAPVVAPSPASVGASNDFYRRNSFSEKTSLDSHRGSPLVRPPRFQSPTSSGARYMRHMPQAAEHAPIEAPMDHAMPFTFDPLFVDDPLSSGNNVGRNAFRIFQVQRAFSDAHRALVASLEWDIQSAGDLHDHNDYPLLKCLLQSEDVLHEL